ncbi:hypothetical protein [Acanthopleuribacter pedis]|uniref:Uncharacterized protein n=1 Tax=Acanthopleuribacter pedis TaxID=442870 RepID=A0A8J7Q9T3_9BACT|nr:hypothetical protein [Acanthopleuribacter pedis]MBO1321346.1 hypothetical protein [Acanthopleuribacter pedis]
MNIKYLLMFIALVQALIIAYFLGLNRHHSQPRPSATPTGTLFTTLTKEQADQSYRDGMRLLTEEGPARAQAFFETRFQESGHLTLLYGLAWTQYLNQDQAAAERNLVYILDHQPDTELAAHCHYLQGYLALNQARHQDAINGFEAAHHLYRLRDKQNNLFKCEIGMASAAVFQRRYERADELLNIAFSRFESGKVKHLGHFYHLKAKVSFGRKRWAAARTFAEKELAEFERIGDALNTGVAYGDLAFFRGLTGDLAGSLAANTEAESRLTQLQAQDKLIQTKINRILLAHCEGRTEDRLVEEVRAHVEAQNDLYAGEQLELLEDWECP